MKRLRTNHPAMMMMQKQTFVHDFPLFCAPRLRIGWDAGSGESGDKEWGIRTTARFPIVNINLVPKPGLEPGRILSTTPSR